MKQWVTILLLFWATASLASAEEHHARHYTAEMHATQLCEQNMPATETDEVPLFATPSTAPRQLISAEQTLPRTNRTSNEYIPDALHAHGCTLHCRVTALAAAGHTVSPAGILTPGRYLYYLRKIVI